MPELFERFKRPLLIFGFILIAAGVGYALYALFFKPTTPSYPVVEPTDGYEGTLPSAGKTTGEGVVEPTDGLGSLPLSETGEPTTPAPSPSTKAEEPRVRVLSPEVTRAISLSPGRGGIRSYNPGDGKFYRVLDDGTAVALSDQVFYDVKDVTWGKKTDKAVIEYPDGAKILYDFSNNQQVTLPKHWEDFDFAPQDDQIAAKSVGNNESNRFLVVANPDGTNAQPIEELGENHDKVHVSWSPNNQIVAYSFTGDPIGFDRQAVILLGKNQENFKNLIVEGRGFVPNWSPSGQTLLYSVHNSNDGFIPTLWLSGASGDAINANRRNLGIQTWADKCAWQSEATIICAVPTTLEVGAGLQRATAAGTPDKVIRVNTRTGEIVDFGQPPGNPTINQLLIAPDGNAVYFNNSYTGQLLRFSLLP